MNIIQALDDPKIFAPFVRGSTWNNWRVFLAALFALPMTAEQITVYKQFTGRSTPSITPCTEAWLVIGRRGGKSFILALIAIFLATFRDWRPFLGPGEVATIMIIARDRRQARVIKRFITGLLHEVPMLKGTIENETRETISLRHCVSIEIHTASFRSTRGYTIIAALLDEIAYWETDEFSSEPDIEVINALRPGMATIPGAMLLCASSPHARKGALWEAHRKHFGKDGDEVLVWQADTRSMNSTVRQTFIDQHMAEDAARAQSEYGAQFRSDLEAFVLREAVAACISAGVFERAPQHYTSYVGFADPSGGSADSMTLAIGHKDHNRKTVVVDALREARPPFSPETVADEFARLLMSYRIMRITGDRYAGEWPREQFSKFGIYYEATAKSKSDMYVDLLPLINSRQIDLLDHTKLINQLCSLERRTARSGRDSIDHPPHGHDDLINAVAGLAAAVTKQSSYNLDAMIR